MSVTAYCIFVWITGKMYVSVGRKPSYRLKLTHYCDSYRKAN